jgi:hypothetical protein
MQLGADTAPPHRMMSRGTMDFIQHDDVGFDSDETETPQDQGPHDDQQRL